ncbi:MAG: ATP-binding protein [Lachnospiraceae bacterium]|nr:ATP-binding protein [Lachnospiraceae bacterium]
MSSRADAQVGKNMFIGREKELDELLEQIESNEKTAVLIYGRRRVGKSTMIAKAAEKFKGVVIDHMCVESTFDGNMSMLSRSVCSSLSLPDIRFPSLKDVFDFLEKQSNRILLILDEYQYLRNSLKKNEVDSYMQAIIDRIGSNVKVILCGSYVAVMRELLEEEDPLFGRFTKVMHIEEFDYYDASRFAPNESIRRKIENYAIFGGSPYVQSCLDQSASVKENIIRLILPDTGILRIYIENIMLKEIQKTYDVRIFEAIGNGRKKYSELSAYLGGDNNGLLDKQLKNLINMEAIDKVFPINRQNDKRKQFYEIRDNLMRFYFCYIFGNQSLISKLGADKFYSNVIEESVNEFISRRFEDIVIQYFKRAVRCGKLTDVFDFGSYWYDDPANKTNGQFDCVLKRADGYDVFECKYYNRPMKLSECQKEEKQVKSVSDIKWNSIGFVCSAGFDFRSDEYALIDGNEIYLSEVLQSEQ